MCIRDRAYIEARDRITMDNITVTMISSQAKVIWQNTDERHHGKDAVYRKIRSELDFYHKHLYPHILHFISHKISMSDNAQDSNPFFTVKHPCLTLCRCLCCYHSENVCPHSSSILHLSSKFSRVPHVYITVSLTYGLFTCRRRNADTQQSAWQLWMNLYHRRQKKTWNLLSKRLEYICGKTGCRRHR